jgi:glycosyltransferase involved in cell wall biosynthesis
MNSMPLLSIIINNYNYGEFVGEAIKSALAQPTGLAEVIIVDDGSTDNSREVIRKYADRATVILQSNGGQGAACNAGLLKARGDWVIFLDADDILLERAAEFLAGVVSPGVSKVTWQMFRIGRDGRRLGGLLPQETPETSVISKLANHGPMSFVYSPTTGNAWSKQMLDAVCPIPEKEFPDTIDGYLAHTAPFYGRIVRIDRSLSSYRVHGENMYAARSEFENRDLIRSRYSALADVVARHLDSRCIEFDPDCWKQEHWAFLDRFESAVESNIPSDETVILVDDDKLNAGYSLFGRPRRFLLERDGHYDGIPEHAGQAVEQIRKFTHEDVGYLIFISYSFWWIEHFPALSDFLAQHAVAIHKCDAAMIYQLGCAAGNTANRLGVG